MEFASGLRIPPPEWPIYCVGWGV